MQKNLLIRNRCRKAIKDQVPRIGTQANLRAADDLRALSDGLAADEINVEEVRQAISPVIWATRRGRFLRPRVQEGMPDAAPKAKQTADSHPNDLGTVEEIAEERQIYTNTLSDRITRAKKRHEGQWAKKNAGKPLPRRQWNEMDPPFEVYPSADDSGAHRYSRGELDAIGLLKPAK